MDSTNGINNNTEILTYCTGNTAGDMSMLTMFISVWCVKNICFTRFGVEIVVKVVSFSFSCGI